MDRADLQLGFLLAYVLAAAVHFVLAGTILRRVDPRADRGAEARLFAWSNLLLGLWHLLQFSEYANLVGMAALRSGFLRALLGLQLVVGLGVLAIFLHLLSTFERTFRRRPTSLRAALTGHLHRHARVYVPFFYALVVLGGLLYLTDVEGTGHLLDRLRQTIGPTSAYLFGFVLLLIVFVLFPARPGQEHLVVPALARAALLASLAVTLLLVALWHRSHPSRTTEVLLPWLHLQSVPFAVFLALVRYEFPFMDRFVRETLRVTVWAGVAGAGYWLFHRVHFDGADGGRFATSLVRLGVLLGAIGLAPFLGERVARFSDRVLFGRGEDLETAVRRFSRRLAAAPDLGSLLEAASADIAQAVHAKDVRIQVGGGVGGGVGAEKPASARLRLPLGSVEAPPGFLLLGERRNLYPYFDEECRYLRVVASLLGAAVTSLRRAGSGPVMPVSDPSPVDGRGGRRVFPPQGLDPRWTAEVLGAAVKAAGVPGEGGAELSSRLLRHLQRLTGHLDPDQGAWTTLGSELGFARDWLALERLRRRNALDVDVRVERGLEDQEIPRGSLLPLLRNALEHGLRGLARRPRLEVRARARDQDVCVEVVDNGGGWPSGLDPMAPPEGGGLHRLLACLREMEGNRACLELDPGTVEGVCIRCILPRRVHRG